ncbi:hypothetical protein [Streptomyces sp. NPDC002088]|uniref:hypothetical protein n=1 Tax=Streptomyces sp. NPDC002088 TaxID=3154665 RepID=UPI003318E1DB
MQIAAVSRDQTRNTMTLMPSLMSDKLIETYGIKAGTELIRANGGRQRLDRSVVNTYVGFRGVPDVLVGWNATNEKEIVSTQELRSRHQADARRQVRLPGGR